MSKFTLTAASLLTALACSNATASYILFPEVVSISEKEWTTESENPKFFISKATTNKNGYSVDALPPQSNLAAACTFSNPNVLKFSTTTLATETTGLVIIDTNEARKLPRGANNITISCDTWVASRGLSGYGPVEVNPAKITTSFMIHNTYPDLTRAVARIDDSNRSAIKLNITRPQADVSSSRGANFWIAASVPGRVFGVAENQLFFLTPKASGGTEWKQLTSGDALSVAYAKNQSAANSSDEIPVNFGFSKEEMASIGATVFFAYQIDGKDINILDYAWNPAVATLVAGNYASVHKLYAYETLNKVREITGLGYVKPVAALDSAAQSHADYLKLNNVSGHSEVEGKPGFTGVTAWHRLQKIELFENNVSEVITPFGENFTTLWTLLGGPYHAIPLLLNGYPEIGIGVNDNGNNLVINARFNPPLVPDVGPSTVFVYPCNGLEVSVKNQGYEIPNPPPLNGKRDFGYSSIAKVRWGQKLVVDSWELRDASNNLVNTVVMTKDNDTTQNFNQSMAALIPVNPLPVVATSYTSILRGKNNGVPFEKTCTWRTVGEGEIASN